VDADSRLRTRVGVLTRRAGAIGLIASALLAAGCGSATVNSAAEQAAQGACLSASAHIKDASAKHAADQACRAVGSGSTNQLAHAAILAARQACLQASHQITDPTVRSAAKAACPAGK